MIDVIDIGDRFHGHVVIDFLARGSLDRDGPFARFCAQQDDLARLFVMDHQGVRIRDHFYGRSFSGTDVVDYVALSRVQGEQQTRTEHQHTDSGDEPRKQSTSSFSFHLLHLAFFAAYGMSIVFGVGT